MEYFSSDAGALVDFHVHVGAALTPPCVPAHEKAVNSRTGGSLPIVAVRGVFGYCAWKASNGSPVGDDWEKTAGPVLTNPESSLLELGLHLDADVTS